MRSREEGREEKYRQLTTAPLGALLWEMALPSMAGMMTASLYSMTDTYFVGKLDRAVLAAGSATSRIKDGDMVLVDGDSGKVVIL